MKPHDAASLPVVAVTGGSGFIGSRLIQRLSEAGYPVRVLSHRRRLETHSGLEVVPGSLEDAASLALLAEGADIVVHCGGIVAAARDRDFQRVNAAGTGNLVTAAQQQGVNRFLLISSLAARHPDISLYARSKRDGEEYLRHCATMAWDIIRPPAVYGPGDLHALLLLKALKTGIGLLPAGQEGRASLLYIDDLVDAIVRWVESGSASRSVFEIDDGAANGHSWRDILGSAAGIMGARPRFVVPPRFLLATAAFLVKTVSNLTGSSPFLTKGKINELCHEDWVSQFPERFTEQTLWRPRVSLQEGMKATLCWYSSNNLL